MKSPFVPAALACALFAGMACDDEPTAVNRDAMLADVQPQPNVVGSPNDQQAIQQIIATFDRTWGVDAATYAAQYAGADWVGPSGEILDTPQILAVYQSIFPAFAGTTRTSRVRKLTFLTGTIAVVNLDVRVTGALPPFVTPWQPGVVRALEKNILVKRAGEWRIVEHQQILPAPGV